MDGILLDLRGLICPLPKMRLIEALLRRESDRYVVLLDYPPAKESIVCFLDVGRIPYQLSRDGDDTRIVIDLPPRR